jgi:hypothetical protein
MKKLNIMMMEDFFREQVEPRRRQEERDSRRVKCDYTAIANLSKEPMCKEFPVGIQVERLFNPANDRD